MSTNEIVYKELSYRVVGLAMEAHKKLGYGFLEKVYENAMMVLLKREGISAIQQMPVKVFFEGVEIGHYIVDILVDNKIILELKTGEALCEEHRAQTLNYLKATELRLAILLNFGRHKLQYERLVN